MQGVTRITRVTLVIPVYKYTQTLLPLSIFDAFFDFLNVTPCDTLYPMFGYYTNRR